MSDPGRLSGTLICLDDDPRSPTWHWSVSFNGRTHGTHCGNEADAREDVLAVELEPAQAWRKDSLAGEWCEACGAAIRDAADEAVDRGEGIATDGGEELTDTEERWAAMGQPVPEAAERVDSGDCSYDDCDASAEYRVEFVTVNGQHRTVLMCSSCSVENAIHVEANDLLDQPLSDEVATDGGEDQDDPLERLVTTADDGQVRLDGVDIDATTFREALTTLADAAEVIDDIGRDVRSLQRTGLDEDDVVALIVGRKPSQRSVRDTESLVETLVEIQQMDRRDLLVRLLADLSECNQTQAAELLGELDDLHERYPPEAEP